MVISDSDLNTIKQTPGFKLQWYLQNTGQAEGTTGTDANVVDAWSTATGEGVVIGFVDSGIEEHPDLENNYAFSLSYDFVDDDANPRPGIINQSEDHGTWVAGVAVADGDNDEGIIGVAPDAKFASLRSLPSRVGDILSDSSEVDRLKALFHKNQEIDIYNNSWTFINNTEEIPAEITEGIENSIREGRGGLGNIYVFGAGNDGLEDNVNYDPLTNSRYSIAVAAIDNNGEHSSYSTPGASLLISGYSGNELDPNEGTEGAGIVTTNGSYRISPIVPPSDPEYVYVSGTSVATPMVSGVIALMLEANPNLTWRDVQHIIVETAEKNDPEDADWVQNGAGYDVNHKYGFGAIDATAAVNAATDWETVAEEKSVSSEAIEVDSVVPGNNTEGVSSTFTIEENINIEKVEIDFDYDINFDYANDGRDLEVVLTSPDGTESVLAEQHGSTTVYEDWTFTSARHWGEASEGEWTLSVVDSKENSINGTWNSWEINLYGTERAEEDPEPPEDDPEPPEDGTEPPEDDPEPPEDGTEPPEDDPEPPDQTIELFRFRNTTFDTGTYVFVGAEERDDILENPDLNQTFELEGDGNAAFVASTEEGEDLVPFYRLASLDIPGTYLFASTEEYDAIFAEDSPYRNIWEKEGLDEAGEDVPEFYLYEDTAERGIVFNRFQNTENGTFLYASEEETAVIENDPNLSDLFTNQGIAFKSLS
jgi:subtilisin-like proprotein convertase family protein